MKSHQEGEECIMTTGISLQLLACLLYIQGLNCIYKIQLIKMYIWTLMPSHFKIIYLFFVCLSIYWLQKKKKHLKHKIN